MHLFFIIRIMHNAPKFVWFVQAVPKLKKRAKLILKNFLDMAKVFFL